ncbi:hypothetical protein VTO73DRAFT_13918 [Trametes versicolor]
MIGSAAFTTLRTYALSGKSKILRGLGLVLSVAPFVVNASDTFLKSPINLPAPLNCVQNSAAASASLTLGQVFVRQTPSVRSADLDLSSRGCLILADSLAIVITWCQTRMAIQLRAGPSRQLSLEQVMWENGAIYFLALVSLNVVDIVLDILSVTQLMVQIYNLHNPSTKQIREITENLTLLTREITGKTTFKIIPPEAVRNADGSPRHATPVWPIVRLSREGARELIEGQVHLLW